MTMPLNEMSPNRQDSDVASRKRSHDEFSLDVIPVEDVSRSSAKDECDGTIQPSEPIIMSLPDLSRESSPSQSSPASLIDALSSTPARNSPSPNPTPTRSPFASGPRSTQTQDPPQPAPGTSTQPPTKKRRLTAAEKVAKAEEDARKKQEKEDIKKQKAAKAEDEARRKQEKEELKRQKLAEKAKAEQEKAEARAAKQAEKSKRDAEEAEKRRKKEEEERKAQEEKEKKERSQLRLNKFFTKVPAKTPTTPKKGAAATEGANGTEETIHASVPDPSPVKKETKSVYNKMFQPFFVKENVHLAVNVTDLDPETKGVKSRILDEYVTGKRGTDVAVQPFRPTEVFRLVSGPRRRGYIETPVKEIVEQLQTSDSARARKALKKVTMKQLCFKQDVRPAYCGTVTRHQHAAGEAKMHRLARRPNGRILDLQYDYDSEAEWQDDEQGEDLDDADDDDEDDGDDDMDGFLDDSEDAGLARRLFNNGGEPESTGICFETGRKQTGGLPKTYMHRLEFIHPKLNRHSGIDPFSTSYWEDPKKKTSVAQARLGQSKMAPPPAPTNTTGVAAGKPQFTQPQFLDEFKALVAKHKSLTKVGFMDVLFAHFKGKGLSRDAVKKMLDSGAARKKGMNGEWRMHEGL